MHSAYIPLIFFFYGLSFFSMGLAILLELGRCADSRLRYALRYLALFGLLHGAHEWLEMFLDLGALPGLEVAPLAWESLRLVLLAFSFVALGAFGASLLVPDPLYLRLSLLAPLGLLALWAFGLLYFQGRYSASEALWDVADVWTRYSLAIPSALLACTGLVFQQRHFRQAGLARFGQDSLWAAIAFAWYGLIGQTFTRPSPLPPSDFLNTELFLHTFGFPVQLLRAGAALLAATFVIRFLRSFEVETRSHIARLQVERLEEAQRREMMRSELLWRVVSAQEAERQRIARELHDETGQALTALGMGLRGISTSLHTDLDKASRNLRQLEGLAAHSLTELQRLIADLRPSHLDDLGLPAALRWYCNELQNRCPIQISVEVEGEARETTPEVKTALFRVAQEALTNVIKHARASQAVLKLCYQSDVVTLTVEDNGRGFDPAILKRSSRPSWGLLGMEERATLLGGRLSIRARPGAGALVEVTIPYLQGAEVMYGDTTGIGG